jgi:hypothetical protein
LRKLAFLLFMGLFSLTSYAEDCVDCINKQTEKTLPEKPKFDFNSMGCYNYYAVDLGIEEAKKKCEVLSKVQNFSDPSFSACNEYFQPSRSEWKAVVADRCLVLAKKIKFESKSFASCVEHLSITSPGKANIKKSMIVAATEQCMDMDPKVDFASKSFITCFYVRGGNKHPLQNSSAEESIVAAKKCSAESVQYDFKNPKFYECWNNKRKAAQDLGRSTDECLQASF